MATDDRLLFEEIRKAQTLVKQLKDAGAFDSALDTIRQLHNDTAFASALKIAGEQRAMLDQLSAASRVAEYVSAAQSFKSQLPHSEWIDLYLGAANQARATLATINDLKQLEDTRVALLGKSGAVSSLTRLLGSMPDTDRKAAGPAINGLRDAVAETIAEQKSELEAAELDARLKAEHVDLTLPPRPRRKGSVHPTMQVMDEMIALFAEMGFAVAEGPDIEDDFHNFTALNFPPKHPARETHDTFFLTPDPETGERKVLRTHTSPVQVRTMMSQKPPIRIIAPGRTFRKDSDATHTPMFHQVEGLVIDKGIHMGHLKWTLETFVARFFEVDDVDARFRPHHFPFTEPSAEMDIRCDRSGGELKLNQGDSWMEILGCGMVHPNVLRNCGVDPDEYQGFAFGMGVDRLAMLKYGIPDLRPMFEADTRWLAHYGFSAFAAPNPASGLS